MANLFISIRFVGSGLLGLLLSAAVPQLAAAQTTLSSADSVQTSAPEPALPAAPEPAAAPEAPEAPEVAGTTSAAAAMAVDTVVASELRRLDEQWAAATVRNDAETLNQLLAPDYVSIDSKGRTVQRTDILRAIANERVKITVNKGYNYLIRVHGDVGVVMHHTSFMGSLNGQDTSGEYRATHLYVRRGGRWQLSSSQTTSVAPPDAPRSNRAGTSLSALR